MGPSFNPRASRALPVPLYTKKTSAELTPASIPTEPVYKTDLKNKQHSLPPSAALPSAQMHRTEIPEHLTPWWSDLGAALPISDHARTLFQGLFPTWKSRTPGISSSVEPWAGNRISLTHHPHPLHHRVLCGSSVAMSREALCKWWSAMQTTGALEMCLVPLQDLTRHHNF